MEGFAFARLTRFLSLAGSRRRALGSLLVGPLGVLGCQREQGAAKKKKPCPPCKKRKKGKCKGTLPDGTVCVGGTCQGGSCVAETPPLQPPDPTCSDGIRNGSESDIDCGGSCSRCANGRRCNGRDDCIGALCINNVCTSCNAIDNECFSDSHGACTCQNGIIGPVCTSSEPLATNVPLADCPPGTTAFVADVTGIFCFGPCGGV